MRILLAYAGAVLFVLAVWWLGVVIASHQPPPHADRGAARSEQQTEQKKGDPTEAPPESIQPASNQEESSSATARNWEKDTQEALAGHTRWLKWFTFFLVLATGGLAYVGYRQWQDTRLLQRAYLAVEIGNIRALTNESKYVARIIVRNAGHVPARNVCWVFGEPRFSSDHQWNPSGDPAATPSGAVTLAPAAQMMQGGGGGAGGPGFDIPSRATPEAKFLYIWGYVKYHDGFQDGRVSQFCHRYNMDMFIRQAEGAGARAFPKKAYRLNRYYNDAT